MNIPEVKNSNYAATIVRLKHFQSIPKRDFIQHALIMGNSVIVSNSAVTGDLGVYFPVESQLAHDLVAYNNGY